MARAVIETVRRLDPPGRFLERKGTDLLWSEVDESVALKKAQQCLREPMSKKQDGCESPQESKGDAVEACRLMNELREEFFQVATKAVVLGNFEAQSTFPATLAKHLVGQTASRNGLEDRALGHEMEGNFSEIVQERARYAPAEHMQRQEVHGGVNTPTDYHPDDGAEMDLTAPDAMKLAALISQISESDFAVADNDISGEVCMQRSATSFQNAPTTEVNSNASQSTQVRSNSFDVHRRPIRGGSDNSQQRSMGQEKTLARSFEEFTLEALAPLFDTKRRRTL